jgi:hypothetical protein
VEALPGHSQGPDDDRVGCGEFLMVAQEQEATWVSGVAEIDDHDVITAV